MGIFCNAIRLLQAVPGTGGYADRVCLLASWFVRYGQVADHYPNTDVEKWATLGIGKDALASAECVVWIEATILMKADVESPYFMSDYQTMVHRRRLA